jgi:hypothetical protein
MRTDWLDKKPIYVSWMWERSIATSEAEIAWCERIAQKIEDGTPYTQ